MSKRWVQILGCGLVAFALVGCHSTTHQQAHKKPVKRSVPCRSNNITAINPSSYKKAYETFLARAEQGDAVAEFNLGRMYADGRGVSVDDAKALSWFKKAAKKGYPDANISIAVAYLYGKGTEKDKRHACKIFKQSMRNGQREAKDFYKHYC